jgi:ligand-binding sensor domain-containing protein
MAGSKDGSLWVSCGENGLLQIKGESSRFWAKSNEGSAVTNVHGIFEAGDGSIWFAGACLARFADEHFEIFGSESGLPNTEFSAVIEDKLGALWVLINDKSQQGRISISRYSTEV